MKKRQNFRLYLGPAIVLILVLVTIGARANENSIEQLVLNGDVSHFAGKPSVLKGTGSPIQDSVEEIQTRFPRVLRSFWREYPEASNTKWYIGENCVFVYFDLAGRKAVSAIRHGGFIEYTTRYLGNEELPAPYAKMITNSYTDFSIISVREVTVNEETSFIVVLENESGYLELSARSLEIRELKKVSKN